jgi:hypothetical protein
VPECSQTEKIASKKCLELELPIQHSPSRSMAMAKARDALQLELILTRLNHCGQMKKSEK